MPPYIELQCMVCVSHKPGIGFQGMVAIAGMRRLPVAPANLIGSRSLIWI